MLRAEACEVIIRSYAEALRLVRRKFISVNPRNLRLKMVLCSVESFTRGGARRLAYPGLFSFRPPAL